MFMEMKLLLIILSYFIVFYFFYSFIVLLLLVEFFMMIYYIYFSFKNFLMSMLMELMFLFICMMVLEGVMGLCMLMKNYRFKSENFFYSW